MKRFRDNIVCGILLNLILPGAGHIYFREYLFGLFVFLIMLIASVMFFAAFLIQLSGVLKAVLFGLPIVFYLFSFLDLHRSVRKKEPITSRSIPAAWIIFLLSLAVALLAPLSPVNFMWRNRPQFVTISDSSLQPLLNEGDLALVDRSAYRVTLFFLDRPLDRGAPERWSLVTYQQPGHDRRLGLVLGLGGEEVWLAGDTLFVDGYPIRSGAELPHRITGNLPLTPIEPSAILVATLKDGTLESSVQVPRRQIIGEVHRLF